MPHKIKITMKVVNNQTLYCRSYDTDNSNPWQTRNYFITKDCWSPGKDWSMEYSNFTNTTQILDIFRRGQNDSLALSCQEWGGRKVFYLLSWGLNWSQIQPTSKLSSIFTTLPPSWRLEYISSDFLSIWSERKEAILMLMFPLSHLDTGTDTNISLVFRLMVLGSLSMPHLLDCKLFLHCLTLSFIFYFLIRLCLLLQSVWLWGHYH